MSQSNPNHTNALIHASSPYLLQHAHQPVDWYEWGPTALEKAKSENKPLLISIGYSACHWCHVMAHEVFDDPEMAAIMNEHFVNIKIDREERPDIDQIYMDTLQILTGRGGWPLNIFVLPDGRPFYGGTYFPKKDWAAILEQLTGLWYQKPDTVYEYASRLTEGIKQNYQFKQTKSDWVETDFHEAIKQYKATWDPIDGGLKRAPKFPLPVIYKFALHYFHIYHDPEVLEWILTSLHKMSLGGLYDTVAGGYARYSVDGIWMVPHFEKMLYDNAQILGVLAETYMITADELLKSRMDQTLAFLNRELTAHEGGLYAALDADSEGVEGLFYCYTYAQLEQTNALNQNLVTYFNLKVEGNWEHGLNILHANITPQQFAKDNNLNTLEFLNEINAFTQQLMQMRATRVRPGLDDKILTSWNALAVTGLIKCYKATGNMAYLEKAEIVTRFLTTNLWVDGVLYRNFKNGTCSIPGFLEDYAFLAEALTELYQVTFKSEYLVNAKDLLIHITTHFSKPGQPYFVFNPDPEKELFASKTDLGDDVIPCANSCICNLLFKHAFYFNKPEWRELAIEMLSYMRTSAMQAALWHANWLSSAMLLVNGVNQLSIVGTNDHEISGAYLPNTILAKPNNDIPLTEHKSEMPAGYYLCRDFECYAPETNFETVAKRLY